MKEPQPQVEPAPPSGEETVEEPSLLENLAAATRAARVGAAADPSPLVGECVDDRHPAILGRYLVRWTDDSGEPVERWLPCVEGVVVRPGDRVVMAHPRNFAEPVVLGVLGGFSPRPEPRHRPGPTLELPEDEALQVTTRDGRQLLEVYQDQNGPVVRLLCDTVGLKLPGDLSLDARSITLRAREGEVQIEASDDVVVRGERIKMN